MDRQKSAGLSLKRKFYGLKNKAGSAKELYEEDVLIDPTDTATSIVFTFPEILSFDSDSAAYVRLNIIDQEPTTYMLSQIIAQQGPNWANNVVLKDDDGKPYRDPYGKIVQIIQYSNTTMQYAGAAIKDSLSKVKQDARFYVNLSNIADESQLKGKLATFMDGQTYTDICQARAVRH